MGTQEAAGEAGQPTFETFKRFAQDPTMTIHEKIGFPDSYREGKEQPIFADIRRKLPALDKVSQTVLDIGPGCSALATTMIDWCRRQKHKLVLIDSAEMLDLLPDDDFISKFPARYPDECGPVFETYRSTINVILCYSVFHYVFVESNVFAFMDRSIGLLSDGGEMLIGDIPNISKRKRFFSSRNGVLFHQSFMQTEEVPKVEFNVIEPDKIDDAVLLGLVLRARGAGCDAYLLPQSNDLPMANRREDLLIRKP